MDDSYQFVKSWAELYAASPETFAATVKHWYTVPRASKSGFFESKLPSGSGTGASHIDLYPYRLPFIMCELAKNDHYSANLDDLAEKAAAFIADKVVVEKPTYNDPRLVTHQSLREAFGKGLDVVYTLAGLTPAETKVAQYMMAGRPDAVISELMGYTGAAAADGRTIRQQKSRVIKKLRALILEEGK